jgi:hypothetical protein
VERKGGSDADGGASLVFLVRHARIVAAHADGDERVRSALALRALARSSHGQSDVPFVRALVTERLSHGDVCPRMLAFLSAPDPKFNLFVKVLEHWRGSDIVHGGEFQQTGAWREVGKLRDWCVQRAMGWPVPRAAVFDGWLRAQSAPELTGWFYGIERRHRPDWQLEQACRAAKDLVSLVSDERQGAEWRKVLGKQAHEDVTAYVLGGAPAAEYPWKFTEFVTSLQRLAAAFGAPPASLTELDALSAALPPPEFHLSPLLVPGLRRLIGRAVASDAFRTADVSAVFERYLERPLAELDDETNFGCSLHVNAFLAGLRGRNPTSLLDPTQAARLASALARLDAMGDIELRDPGHELRGALLSTAVAAGRLDLLEQRLGDPSSDDFELYLGVQALATFEPGLEALNAGAVTRALGAVRQRLLHAPGRYAGAIFALGAELGAKHDPDWAERASRARSEQAARRYFAPAVVQWMLGAGFDPALITSETRKAGVRSAKKTIASADRASVERSERFLRELAGHVDLAVLQRWANETHAGVPAPSGGELATLWSALRRAVQAAALENAPRADVTALVLAEAARAPQLIAAVRAMTTSRESLVGLLTEALSSLELDDAQAEQVIDSVRRVVECRVAERPVAADAARRAAFIADAGAKLRHFAAWEQHLKTGGDVSAVLTAACRQMEQAGGWPRIVTTLVHNVKNRCARYETDERTRDTTPRATALDCLRKCRALLFDALSGFEDVSERGDAVRDAVALVRRASGSQVELHVWVHDATVDVAAMPYLLVVEELVQNAVRYASVGAVDVYSPWPPEDETWDLLVVAAVPEAHRVRLLNALGRRADDSSIDAVALPKGSSGLGLPNVRSLAAECELVLDTTMLEGRLGVGLRRQPVPNGS